MLVSNSKITHVVISLALLAITSIASARGGQPNASSMEGSALTEGDKAHLIFMREEEKLARDVYLTLGSIYPNSPVFGKIDDSEQKHTMAVKNMIERYGLEDPSTNDNVGVFTGADYGWYFTEKYEQLVTRAKVSEFDALYVGAFIEELDMMDITQCPTVIIDTNNEVNDFTQCGSLYTDNPNLQRLYSSLLAGSGNHLNAYVKKIEKEIGYGNYQAQVLPQEQVDQILGR